FRAIARSSTTATSVIATPTILRSIRLRSRRKRVWLTVWERPDSCATMIHVTTVLIVDDHPSFRANAHALLEAEGFKVVGEAENGETALAEATRLRPDL